MKKLTLTLLMTLMASAAFADNSVPHVLNFQSVLRDDGGNLIPDGPVTLNFKILDVDGTQLYQEAQNADVVRGAVNVMIGEGDIPGFDTPTGGLSVRALDPTSGEKFVQYQIGSNLPVDPISIGSVPYALWAEKALTVAHDAIGSDEIRNGTIKAEDLEPGSVQFSDINGLVGATQLPADVLHLRDLNNHKTETNAHMASTIGVVGPLATTRSNVLEDVIKDMDRILNGLNQSSIDRTTVTTSINNEINSRTTADNALSSSLTTHTGAISAHGSDGSVVGQNTLNTAINTRVSKGGDTMSGDLTMNANIVIQSGRTVDGVDVSDLNQIVRASPDPRINHETRITRIESRFNASGQVTDAQVPQYMRPAAFFSAGNAPGADGVSNSYNIASISSVSAPCATVAHGYSVPGTRLDFSTPLPSAAYVVLASGYVAVEKNVSYFVMCNISNTLAVTARPDTDVVVFQNYSPPTP